MKVQKIGFTPYYYKNNNLKITQPQSNPIEYNPIAYKDFNISFGARLFRTPKNFYEQKFNMDNMPDTMKNYLMGDREDRENIPPAQMMKIVFGDVNYASSLEEVKELYPEEPLFKNLKTPNKNFREGILAELDVMKDEGKPVFKNGENDLGLYILKKIYLEGKMLSEINKDFRKDVAGDYDALSPITYKTIADFGISFPSRPFWKSFLATREDFPYVYKPRKEIESRVQGQRREYTISDINKGILPPSKPRYSLKDHEIKKVVDSILDGGASKSGTAKTFKKNNIKDTDENVLFIRKYMSQIMSIALERVHASEEMTSFFEDFDSFDVNQQKRMKKYWDQSPQMKALQSIVMSDTIKLFFETYGADGNNDEFRSLVEYANSIKTQREERKLRHNQLQDEYEAALAIYDEPAGEKNVADKPIEQVVIKPTLSEGDSIKTLKDYILRSRYRLYPTSYINRYAKFLDQKDENLKKYIVSYVYHFGNDKVFTKFPLDGIAYDKDEIEEKILGYHKEFSEKNFSQTQSVHQAAISVLSSFGYDVEKLVDLYDFAPLNFRTEISQGYEDPSDMIREMVELKYKEYNAPLNNKELVKISLEYMQLLKNWDIKSSLYRNNNAPEIVRYIKMGKKIAQNKNENSKEYRNDICTFIKNKYGGSARALTDDNLPTPIRQALMEQIFLYYLIDNQEAFAKRAYVADPLVAWRNYTK